ncbi:unnamed protein product, partial [Didymodactylos carnosus]
KTKTGVKKDFPKAATPITDGQTESDTSKPLDNEEIQALAIRLEELEKLHETKSHEENVCTSFIVKRTKSGPQKQPLVNQRMFSSKSSVAFY